MNATYIGLFGSLEVVTSVILLLISVIISRCKRERGFQHFGVLDLQSPLCCVDVKETEHGHVMVYGK